MWIGDTAVCCFALKYEKPDSCESGFEISWRPQGDLNPCRLRERQVSWARLDDGDAS